MLYSHPSDALLLDVLTGPQLQKPMLPHRDSCLDPLLIAAAAASGPHVTRNHYHHDFFPDAEVAWDWTKFRGHDSSSAKRLAYVSRQAPRRVRLQLGELENLPDGKENIDSQKRVSTDTDKPRKQQPLQVKCMARTRIPTPHGPVFLHLYHNNKDSKEHLAIVVDPAQLQEDSATDIPHLRSRTLDAIWDNETEMDRITRGAYVGRLTPTTQIPSTPRKNGSSGADVPPPLIRLHSECFTGETVGSMRCDCGEQLDEAIRRISQPISSTIPGRGAIIYLRQEGRGIGLLEKIRAYNLQDIGHDTVTANLMLGHKADERGYEVAVAILRDLGLGGEGDEGVRVLTNNPDKVRALEKEGIKVAARVPMIPRSWRTDEETALVGNKTVHGEDLDKYLKTKVLKMGHMLPLINSLAL